MTGAPAPAPRPPAAVADPKEQRVVGFGTAAPGEIRTYYREQMQDPVNGALMRVALP